VLALVTATARAQHAPAEQKPAEQKRGSSEAPTHAPQPELPPALALGHVRTGNQAAVAARKAGAAAPALAPRPSGAGRYVCAVVVCADAEFDVPALLGLRRTDVLLIATPGPFVQPETVALVERCVTEERLSLVLLLTHTHCTTLATKPGVSPRQDALVQRLAAVQKAPFAKDLPLGKALVLAQRQMLLSSSDLLERRAALDQLRVIPGEIDTASHEIVWHGPRVDAMPMPPVK
jgi:hypothetical protein